MDVKFVSTKHRISPTLVHQAEVDMVAVVATMLDQALLIKVIKAVVVTVSGGSKYDIL